MSSMRKVRRQLADLQSRGVRQERKKLERRLRSSVRKMDQIVSAREQQEQQRRNAA